MKTIVLVITSIMTLLPLHAQHRYREVLSEIEQNNTSLKALRETSNAEKLGNRSDCFLPDPEVGYDFLWGNPASIGSRKDLSISQSFDIPTLFGIKSGLADQKNALIDRQYRTERMKILLEAKLYLLDLTYYNGLLKELSLRKAHTEILYEVRKQKLDKGEGNILEYNNVRLNRSKVEAEIKRVETERDAIIAQLTRLNGGRVISTDEEIFETLYLPKEFREWVAGAESKSPVLAFFETDIAFSKKQLLLNKALNLPSVSLGYISEQTFGEGYRGISVGISIPLWSNRNRVKEAKAGLEAARYRREDAIARFYGEMEMLYQRTCGLQEVAATYRRALQEADNSELLKKALDAGEISIVEYMMQVALYYDAVDQALAAERDCHKAFAELTAFEL